MPFREEGERRGGGRRLEEGGWRKEGGGRKEGGAEGRRRPSISSPFCPTHLI
jgi:hypothetical protein